MKIKFNVKPYSVDRRSADLIARGDDITEKLFAVRVAKNLKERQRLERIAPPRTYLLRQQAG